MVQKIEAGQKVFRRVIDYRIEQGGVEAARDQIERARQWDVSLSLSTPEANDFFAQLRVERERKLEESRRRYEQERQERKNDLPSAADAVSGSASGRYLSRLEMDGAFGALVKQVQPGMSTSRVGDMLCRPTKVEIKDVLDSYFEFWCWNERDNPDSFIMLSIEDGCVSAGGTPGYDIKKGFIANLPKGLSKSEREQRKDALDSTGFTVE
jgi:hypothetical protein